MNSMQRGVVLAGAAALGAGALFAASAWRALSLEPVVGDAPAAPVVPAPAVLGQGLNVAALDLVAEHDPFRAQRAPAPLPYRMPGDPGPEEAPPPPAPPPEPPPFQVLGTVAMGNGSGIAVIRTEGQPAPLFLRVGDSLQGFRLTAVHQRSAVLARGDQVVQLAVADPGMVPAPPAREDRRRRGQEEPERATVTVEAMQLRESLLQQQQELMRRQGGGVAPRALADSVRALLQGRVRGAVMVRPPVTRPDTSGTTPGGGEGR